MYEMICVVISGLTFRVGVVCAILEEHGFNRGFTRGTTGACRFGSELLSNEDQCTQAQFFWWFRHIRGSRSRDTAQKKMKTHEDPKSEG